MTGPRTSPRAGRYADGDFDAADRWDELIGFTPVAEQRRRELLAVVHLLAEADRVVEEVRAAMVGPYGGLLRLVVLGRRSKRALARASVLTAQLDRMLDEVAGLPGGRAAAVILQDRLRLHLHAEAELVAGLSPERRRIVEGLRVPGGSGL